MGRNLTPANSSHGGTSINATIYSKDSFDGQGSLFTLGLAIRGQDYTIQLKREGALEKMWLLCNFHLNIQCVVEKLHSWF